MSNLLEVESLKTSFHLRTGTVRAVDEVSLGVKPGETLGLVGESGSGKTATAMSILRLLPRTASVDGGTIRFGGESLLELSDEAMRRVRGRRMALIPQNPMLGLNPVLTIGWQLREAITAHQRMSRRASEQRAIEVLQMTGIPTPAKQLRRFPHEFSGGMRQRVLIAMAVINRPALLLADEPTTALDTTTQAQILELMRQLTRDFDMAMLLITHNMGVVASIAERVAVMYSGEIVEVGPVSDIFGQPKHPYTRMLLASSPGSRDRTGVAAPKREPLLSLEGAGCRFRDRCQLAIARCAEHPALLQVGGHAVRCWVAQSDEAPGRRRDED